MARSYNKKLGTLSPSDFENWFKRHEIDGDWQKVYKSLGGKIPNKKHGNPRTESKD